ncbi:exopolyphosphatase [bacterium]|nr:exopolyphosphatase [bacterium]
MRLITRADFDGLVSAVLLVEKGIVDSYKFAHPKDVQDGKVKTTPNDVLANVPFSEGCGLWFDHHESESDRHHHEHFKFEGCVSHAASTAQVIWDYYGGVQTFGRKLLPMLRAVNIADAGSFLKEEVLNPEGWILLSFIMDSRTGLGYFKDYRISNYQLMMNMIQYCRTMSADEIIAEPDVQERVIRYFDHQEKFKAMLVKSSHVQGNAIITNLLENETIFVGNRFIIYGLFPDQNIDIRIMWGRNRENIVIACGHSILNRSSRTSIGRLMARYGGGGHSMAGTCQVGVDEWESVSAEIISTITRDG